MYQANHTEGHEAQAWPWHDAAPHRQLDQEFHAILADSDDRPLPHPPLELVEAA
jgi:hypothetical protein